MTDRGTGHPARTPRPEPSWTTVIATTLRLWLERHPVVIGRTAVRLRPLLALTTAVEQAGLERAGLTQADPQPADPEQASPAQPGTAAPHRGRSPAAPRPVPRKPRARLAVLAVLAGVLVLGAGTAGLLRATARPAAALPPPAAPAVAAPVGPIAAAVHSQADAVPAPATLTIPDIGVQTRLVDLGLTAAGALQVPSSTAVAGWYTGSPRPGALGPAVIAGHIDSRTGPGVFFDLSRLRPGEHVYVRRSDGTLAVFRVTAVQSYAKDRFPTLAVYGPTPDAELRLITCGGTFDPQLGAYLSNTVAYAVQVTNPA
jgi:sortase (surface protein transpeptidase)